jgi:hypothetical protein
MIRLVCSALLACALVACAGETPRAEQAEAVPPCADSGGRACDNGMPLCMMDEERACRMCQCSEFLLVAEPSRNQRAAASLMSVPTNTFAIFPPVTRTEAELPR